jgi:hypothetical protein
MPGPHCGIGKLAVVDWWLATAWVVADDIETAAAPASTTHIAKPRTKSVIAGNPLWCRIGREKHPQT